MFEFYVPADTGEFLAFCAACATFVAGLLALLFPGAAMRLSGLDLRAGRRGGTAEIRASMGGFPAGVALSAILLAQDWTYLALGAALALAVFGRILDLLSGGGQSVPGWAFIAVQTLCASLSLGHVFGFI